MNLIEPHLIVLLRVMFVLALMAADSHAQGVYVIAHMTNSPASVDWAPNDGFNLIAGERIVRELIQDDCTAEAAAGEAVRILVDAGYRERMIMQLAEVRRRIGGPGASERAAEAVLDVIHSTNAP